MRSFLPFAALFGVAFVLGCQDVGTGPDALVPQFDKPTSNCKNPDSAGHCHEDDAVPQLFTVTVTSGPEHISGSGTTTAVGGGGIIVNSMDLTLSKDFFDGPMTCSLEAMKTAFLFIASGQDHTHLFFEFSHKQATHTLALLGDKPNDWPPESGQPRDADGKQRGMGGRDQRQESSGRLHWGGWGCSEPHIVDGHNRTGAVTRPSRSWLGPVAVWRLVPRASQRRSGLLALLAPPEGQDGHLRTMGVGGCSQRGLS